VARRLEFSDESNNYQLYFSGTFGLLQNRLGMPAVRSFQADVVPVLKIEWVSEALHAAAISALLVANRRQVSLVDCVSFETMRILGLKQVFAFDPDFSQQGFHCLP
jgi:predicted nucleic acid-binding protein